MTETVEVSYRLSSTIEVYFRAVREDVIGLNATLFANRGNGRHFYYRYECGV